MAEVGNYAEFLFNPGYYPYQPEGNGEQGEGIVLFIPDDASGNGVKLPDYFNLSPEELEALMNAILQGVFGLFQGTSGVIVDNNSSNNTSTTDEPVITEGSSGANQPMTIPSYGGVPAANGNTATTAWQRPVNFSGSNNSSGFVAASGIAAFLNGGTMQNVNNSNTANANNASLTSSTSNISSLNTEIAALRSEIETLQQQIQTYDREIARLEAELEEKNQRLQEEQRKLETAEQEYENIEDEIERNKSKYEDITQSIEDATSTLEQEGKMAQQRAIYQAMQDYDEEKDGDWNEFLASRLGNLEFGSTTLANLSNLNFQSQSVMRELGTLKTSLFNKADEITTYSANVNTLNNEIATLNSSLDSVKASKQGAESTLTQKNATLSTKQNELAALQAALAAQSSARNGIVQNSAETVSAASAKTPDEIKNLVSPAEYALVDANNVNLSEKMADGSPRYIFAKGQDDGQYHIYDLQDGDSLARKYGNDGGYDIVTSGNGRIRNCNFLGSDSSQGQEVFYLCDESTVKECKACYCTMSPLSFDIDGDGVNTSDNIINYDIDGDGAIDKIYDSADAVLVFDNDGDGISGEDGAECFGNNTDLDGDGKADGYKDGFEALKALAAKENLISENDSKLDEADIKLLQEKYGLKIKTEGYESNAQTLSDIGITEINLAKTSETTMNQNFDGKGNDLMTQEGATFTINGETRSYADIWHAKLDENDGSKNSYQNSSTISFLSLNKKVNPNLITNDFDDLSASKKRAYDKIEKILKKYEKD